MYRGCLPLKATMCIGIIILQTNKPYPSSCSCFFDFFCLFVFSFITFFRRILLLLLPSSSHFPCSSFPALFLYLFFSHCNVPSLAVMKMCDNWSWIPFLALVFHSLCCLPRSFGTYQIGGSGSKGSVTLRDECHLDPSYFNTSLTVKYLTNTQCPGMIIQPLNFAKVEYV